MIEKGCSTAENVESLPEKMPDAWENWEAGDTLREKIYGKNRTFAADVWFRFRHKTSALIGLIVIFLLTLFAFVGPLFTEHTYDRQNLDYANLPPFLKVHEVNGTRYYVTQGLKLLPFDEDGNLEEALSGGSEDLVERSLLFETKDGPLKLFYAEKPQRLEDASGAPAAVKKVWNPEYPLGSDMLGRDIMARLMFGTRVSLFVALVATLVNMTIGIVYGGISGYVGGMTDIIMMRIVDIISTIPLTLYVILLMVFLDSGLLSIVVALSSVYWVTMAQVVRGQVFAMKDQEFVLAAKTIGSSARTILLRHALPNMMGPILVTATMLIPSAIFMEAFLSFIGLGIAPPMASLGTMCNDSIQTLKSAPYQLFLPSLVICIIMFSFNYVGDGLRDALDPKLKK